MVDENALPEDSSQEDIEELVLKESIVGASGLNAANLLIGIRGDPSIRESIPERKRYDSEVDMLFEDIAENLQEILLNRSTYRIYVGFNNGEIRTHSIFDPLRQEIHSAAKIAQRSYITRQFPPVSYEDKIAFIRDTYAAVQENSIYKQVPGYWKNIMLRRNQSWEPMTEDEIKSTVSTLKVLRNLPEYYLRNVTICTVQSIVRLQFNCDGTQIIDAENYQKFLDDNLPNEELPQ